MCRLRPDIFWQPSDPDSASRASQADWAKDSCGNMASPLNVNVMQSGWESGLPACDVIYCANMIHIAPWAAAEGLAAGAQKSLKTGQLLVLYGPLVETSVKYFRPFTSLTAAALASVFLSTAAPAQVVKPIGFGTPVQPAVPLRLLNDSTETSAAQQAAPNETQQMAILEENVTTPSSQTAMRGVPPLGFPFTYPAKTSLADLVDKVSPAVVNIIVKSETADSVTEGQGSGFVIDPKGELVTNYHVIEGGTTIEVEFNDGERFPAEIVGTDPETDLAVLKIMSDRMFPTVSFYQGSDLRIGNWVVAIGNPFGIGQSTSFGIISAIGRERVESGAYVDYIQTDATINTGNSGGPLFNPKGDVVGVNSAIYSPTGASVGIAFSIPHQTAEVLRSMTSS